MRQTYIATVTREVIFTADVEAGDILDKVARRATNEDDGEPDIDVEPIRYVPSDWDDDCLVYGSHTGYLTLKEALSVEMAPKYHERQEATKRAYDAAEKIGLK